VTTAESGAASGCHVCGGRLEVQAGYGELTRVTSDCKPWPAGGTLGACIACGLVQKVLDARWRAEIDRIYDAYTIYFQGGGAEQAVFSPAGEALQRSERLVGELHRRGLAAEGRAVDVGCGNGAFLAALSRAMPGWSLVGTELSDKYRDRIEAIPRVERLYTGPLDEIPGQFDLVSMIHALEHIPHPVELLRSVAGILRPGGTLFIEVPDAVRNPFDLVIADHASHFTPVSLTSLLARAGYEVVSVSSEWVPKEISLVARPGGSAAVPAGHAEAGALEGLQWLLGVRDAARAVRDAQGGGAFGLFGSSIAATWLSAELAGAAAFFVDEDPSRRGSQFAGRPILAPDQVAPGSRVFIGVGGGLAPKIAARLTRDHPAVRWTAAPPEPPA